MSEAGNVMVCFSPDDVHILSSAVDNAIVQRLVVDGREPLRLKDLPRTGLRENFTRAYYSASGRYIMSGSSEEDSIRLHCAQTGDLIESAEAYPGRCHHSLYVQSLRCDPYHEHCFSILVNYRDASFPLEMVAMDMLHDDQSRSIHTAASLLFPPSLPPPPEEKQVEGGEQMAVNPPFLSSPAPHAFLSPHLKTQKEDEREEGGQGGKEEEEEEEEEVEEEDEEEVDLASFFPSHRLKNDLRELLSEQQAQEGRESGTEEKGANEIVQLLVLDARREGMGEGGREGGRVFRAHAPVAGVGRGEEEKGREDLPPPQEVFDTILSYLYTDDVGDLGVGTTDSDAVLAALPSLEALLSLATAMDLPRLFSAVESRMKQMVAIPTCLPLYLLAQRVVAGQLLAYILYFAASHQDLVFTFFAFSPSLPSLRLAVAAVLEESDGVKPVYTYCPSADSDGGVDSVQAEQAQQEWEAEMMEIEEELEDMMDEDDANEAGEEDEMLEGEEDGEEEEEGEGEIQGEEVEEGEGEEEDDGLPAPPPLVAPAVAHLEAARQLSLASRPLLPSVGTVIAKHMGHTATFIHLYPPLAAGTAAGAAGAAGAAAGGTASKDEGRKEIPSSVPTPLMVVLGGGNRRTFHSFRSILLYNTATRRWLKVRATGDPDSIPPMSSGHTAVPLGDPFSSRHRQRRLIVFGGNLYRRTDPEATSYVEPAYLLSLSNLQWERLLPKTERRKKEEEEEEEEGGGRVSLDHTFPSDMGLPARANHTMHGNEYVATEMFVFGGRNALNYHSMNDIVLLSYLVKGGRENEGGKEEGRFMWSRPEVEGELPEPRESHGAVVVPGTEAEGGDRMLVFGGIRDRLVSTDVCSARVGPSSPSSPSSLPSSPSSSGLRRKKIVWERVTLTGSVVPPARFEHTMTVLDSRHIAVFGGYMYGATTQQAYNDLYILVIESMSLAAGLVCHWAKFPLAFSPSSLPLSPLAPYWEVAAAKEREYPSARCRHTAVWSPSLEGGEDGEGGGSGRARGGGGVASLDGKLLIFGGGSRRPKDTHLYELTFSRGKAAVDFFQAYQDWSCLWRAAWEEARGGLDQAAFAKLTGAHDEGHVPDSPEDFIEHVKERGEGVGFDYRTDPSRIIVVVPSRPDDVAIVAIPQEPPVVILPSTLAVDLLQLLAFDEEGAGREGGREGGVFRHTVGLRVEEVEEGKEGGQAGGEVVWAHKSLLAKRCPHFEAMLGSGMREATQSIITLADVTPPVLRALLVYIYTDTLHANAAVDKVLLPLLLLAHRYDLSALVALCSGYLRRALVDRGSCVDILKWSDAYQLLELKKMCMAAVVMRSLDEEVQGGGEEGEGEGLSGKLWEEVVEFGMSFQVGKRLPASDVCSMVLGRRHEDEQNLMKHTMAAL
ncbi:transducin family protein [Nannochloropsis oceanica]